MFNMFNRREFIAAGASFAAAGAVGAAEESTTHEGIKVRFLGTGAAGWRPGSPRRQSSVLLEGKVLIDFTQCAADMLPEGFKADAIFYTHSHGDHYSPSAALRIGVRRVFAQETWAAGARREFAEAAEKLGVKPPEVTALPFGRPVEVEGLRITGVPANHCTNRITDGVTERTSLYLVEKGAARLLYATDTSGIPGEAARLVGIDWHIREGKKGIPPHVHPGQAITALIMEATMGVGLEDDFRLYVHSSVDTVARTVRVLTKTERYLPPPGQPVYLTHMGVGYSRDPDENDRKFPAPLKSARDGMEVVLG